MHNGLTHHTYLPQWYLDQENRAGRPEQQQQVALPV
jgi:hypothetical protein